MEAAEGGAVTFEEKTYAYARDWAARTRRDFLRQAGLGLGAAGLAMAVGMPRLEAAGGGVAGGIAYGATSIAHQSEQMDREVKAASGALVLSVRTPTAAKRAEAEAILRQAGGTDLAML